MKRQSRTLLVIGMVFLWIGGACAAPVPPTPTPTTVPPAPPTPAPTPGPLDIVKTFQETFNKGDTEGFLALFGDNPDWTLAFSATGKKAVRNIAEFWFELNARIELSDCKLENGWVSCQWAYTDDCLPPEVDAFHYDANFRFTNYKISMFTGQSTNSKEWDVYNSHFALVETWAKQNLPEDYAKYATNAEWNKFSHSGDQGGGNLSATEIGQVVERMCKGYAQAKK